jgi:hypothetical protein
MAGIENDFLMTHGGRKPRTSAMISGSTRPPAAIYYSGRLTTGLARAVDL